MRNRLYIVAAAIVVGLVYLINAQEKAPAPPGGEASNKPPAQVKQAPPAPEFGVWADAVEPPGQVRPVPATAPVKPATVVTVKTTPVAAAQPTSAPAIPIAKPVEPSKVAAIAVEPAKPAETKITTTIETTKPAETKVTTTVETAKPTEAKVEPPAQVNPVPPVPATSPVKPVTVAVETAPVSVPAQPPTPQSASTIKPAKTNLVTTVETAKSNETKVVTIVETAKSNDTKVVATVETAKPPEPAKVEAEFVPLPDQKEIDIKGAVVQMKTNETLSIALDDVDMADVVRMFTRLSKANIIANPSNLVGKVTVNLADVEWKPALMSILDMQNLQLIEKTPGSSVFSIVPKVVGAQEPLVVETMFLKYASVSNVESVVKNMAPAPGSVSVFASRNALVVRATSAQMSEIKTTLKVIDTMREQVFIEAKFMELTDEAIKDLGINWQVLQAYNISAGNLKMDLSENRAWDSSKKDTTSQWDKRSTVDGLNKRYDVNGLQYAESTSTDRESPPGSGHYVTETVTTPTRTISDTIDKGKNITSDAADSFTKAATDVRTAVLGVDDFKIMLSALKQINGVSVVSNPKIMVANEEPATIHIGQEQRPFISSVTPGQQGIAPVVTYNPGTPVQLGVKLTVTPTVNTASNITVKIEPELTRISGTDTAPNGQTYPIVSTKKIKTVFCLESGKTVAIGGLTETSDQDNTKKIPLLGDIPLIGKYLFSWSHMQKGQTETIIFVTVGLALPEAVQAETGLPEDTELAQRKLMENKLKKHKNRQDLERKSAEVNAAIDADSEKAKTRLLKMNK